MRSEHRFGKVPSPHENDQVGRLAPTCPLLDQDSRQPTDRVLGVDQPTGQGWLRPLPPRRITNSNRAPNCLPRTGWTNPRGNTESRLPDTTLCEPQSWACCNTHVQRKQCTRRQGAHHSLSPWARLYRGEHHDDWPDQTQSSVSHLLQRKVEKVLAHNTETQGEGSTPRGWLSRKCSRDRHMQVRTSTNQEEHLHDTQRLQNVSRVPSRTLYGLQQGRSRQVGAS